MSIKKNIEKIHRIYLDAAPIIYYIEDKKEYQQSTQYIFDRIDDGKLTVVTSSILLSEVLVMPFRQGLIQQAEDYRQILTTGENTEYVPILYEEAATNAAKLRAINQSLKMLDAQHLAIAIQSNCDSFLTNDVKLKKVTGLADKFKIILLNELEKELST